MSACPGTSCARFVDGLVSCAGSALRLNTTTRSATIPGRLIERVSRTVRPVLSDGVPCVLSRANATPSCRLVSSCVGSCQWILANPLAKPLATCRHTFAGCRHPRGRRCRRRTARSVRRPHGRDRLRRPPAAAQEVEPFPRAAGRIRLIECPPRRCGVFVPSGDPGGRAPEPSAGRVRGLASERGACRRVSPWPGSKEA